jgi:hypothetical protein
LQVNLPQKTVSTTPPPTVADSNGGFRGRTTLCVSGFFSERMVFSGVSASLLLPKIVFALLHLRPVAGSGQLLIRLRRKAKVVGALDGHFLVHFGNQANDVEVVLLRFFIHDPVAREGPDNVVIRAFRQFSFHLGTLHDRTRIESLE